MESVQRVLEAELKVEQDFVTAARLNEKIPKGWPAALLMYHMSMWRELLRNALLELEAGRSYTPPPRSVDEYNDRELPNGIGTPLADAAARSENLLGEIIRLYAELGERDLQWYTSKNTTEAVLRNSYLHPRLHMYQYLKENGDLEAGLKILEAEADELREATAPPIAMGSALYNLAVVRVAQDRAAEALPLVKEALDMRPDLKAQAAEDEDLAPLRDMAEFNAVTSR